MDSVFVSHANGDRYFVTLFTALLKFHGINVPFCLSNPHGSTGTEYTGDIIKAVDDSDALAVIFSKNAGGAEWIKTDISYFKSKKPEGTVIIVLLDPVQGEGEGEGIDLSPHRCIEFFSCMLTGFRELYSLLGKEFLVSPDRRKKSDRRAHVNVERRKSPIIQRMRKGFWLGYASASGYSKFDTVILDYHLRYKIMDSLVNELQRYEFLDKEGNPRDLKEVLEQATVTVWEELRDRGDVKAVIVIEAIAEAIHRSYEVKTVEQRKEPRRQSDAI